MRVTHGGELFVEGIRGSEVYTKLDLRERIVARTEGWADARIDSRASTRTDAWTHPLETTPGTTWETHGLSLASGTGATA